MKWFKSFVHALAILAVAALSAACGPFQDERFVEIAPNETAYVVPLEGASKSDQGKFDSVAFLDERKVATKRIRIPTRKQETGYFPGDYKWIETVRVIRVDRTPVTREWTAPPDQRTSSKDDALHLESRDSIGFRIGCTITAHIDEGDTSAFLYHLSGKTLTEVVDTNVRSYVQTELMQLFGSEMLSDCLTRKGEFFRTVAKKAADEFKTKGVTIDFFGMQDGIEFDNSSIQEVIDRKFKAENEESIARNETAAQTERNKQRVEAAKGEAQAKLEEAKGAALASIEAAEAEAKQRKLRAEATAYEIATKAEAEAKGNGLRAKALEGEGGLRMVTLSQVERWDGKLPLYSFGGQGAAGASPLLFMQVPPK